MKRSAKSAGFFESVWRLVRRVPPGRVVTYGQVAAMLGHPRAARTVGWAMHSLPEGGDVPWWRVLNAQGRSSIDCLEHSADLQRQLLEQEGVVFDQKGYVDLRIFQWRPQPF